MSRFSFIKYTVRSVLRLHPGGRLRFLSYSVKKTVECTQCLRLGGLERILTSLNIASNSLRCATRKPDATHSSS